MNSVLISVIYLKKKCGEIPFEESKNTDENSWVKLKKEFRMYLIDKMVQGNTNQDDLTRISEFLLNGFAFEECDEWIENKLTTIKEESEYFQIISL